MSALPDHENIEIEMKFSVPTRKDMTAVLEAFENIAGSAELRARTYTTVIRYHDTDDHKVYGAGLIIRKMDAEENYFPQPELHIKTRGALSPDGALVRDEFEYPLASDVVDLDVVSDRRARELVAPFRSESLSEIFNTTTTRIDRMRALDFNGKKTALEICLDHVLYIDGKSGAVLRESFEIELEFKKNHADRTVTPDEAIAAMRHVMNEIRAVVTGVEPLSASKGDIGYALVGKAGQPASQKTPRPRHTP